MQTRITFAAWTQSHAEIAALESKGYKHNWTFVSDLSPSIHAQALFDTGINVMMQHTPDGGVIIWVNTKRFGQS